MNPKEMNEQLVESPEKMRLKQLEAEGKWVFHGSGKKIDVLEPRQAHNHDKDGKATPDDKPAVFASPLSDIAIFMSVINFQNAPRGARSGFSSVDDGPFEYRVTKKTMDQIHNAKGYVYVFNRSDFIPRSDSEVLSYVPVKPVEVIEVTERDLPKNIEIKDF